MPWFGIDIGGTLTKLVYFETKDESHLELEKENEVSQKLRNYLTKQLTYGKSGHRDIHLQVKIVKTIFYPYLNFYRNRNAIAFYLVTDVFYLVFIYILYHFSFRWIV